METVTLGTNHLNHLAREILAAHVIDDYQLDAEGREAVHDANRNLDVDYASSHDFPVNDFWFKHYHRRIMAPPPKSLGTALDVCCGSGSVCLNLMKRNLFDICHAVDINAVAIETLERKAREENITGVQAVCDNVMDLRFEDESFDCVFGNSFLHHLPDNPGFLSEMHRVLRPGGTLCLTHEPTVSATRLEGYLAVKAIGFRDRLRANHVVRKASPVLSDIWLYEECSLASMLREVGFDEVTITARGRLSTVLGSFLERVYTSRAKKAPPLPLLYVRRVLSILDRMVFATSPKDSFSSFSVVARKG